MQEKLNKYVDTYVVFDLETTGVSFRTDDIIEVSAVKVVNGKVVDEFSELVDPQRKIPYSATAVNGITDEMVKGCDTIDAVLKRFLDFASDAILVGHNIHSFDMKFIYRDALKLNMRVMNDYIDTLSLSRIVLPQLNHHRLVDLAGYYGISSEGAHRALNDCRMNQKVFELLGKELKKTPVCPKCKRPLVKRNGKFGDFFGCSGYPECKYTRNV